MGPGLKVLKASLLGAGLLALIVAGCGGGDRDGKASPSGARRAVVYLVVDGLRWSDFWRALDGSLPESPPTLTRVFGKRLSRARYFPQTRSVFPPVTFAANASLVTGVPPGVHGVAGNRFRDRETGATHDLTSVGGSLRVYQEGLADELLAAPTLYRLLPGAAVVSFHMYGGGAEWVTPTAADVFWYLTDPGRYDRLATERLLARVEERYRREGGLPTLMTLYWPGLDAFSHLRGTGAQEEYVREKLDSNLALLLEGNGRLPGLESYTGTELTVVLTADHGMHEALRWIGIGELRHALTDVLAGLSGHGVTDSAELRRRIAVETNGGMAHVYLSSPGDEGEAMEETVLEEVARGLAASDLLGGKLGLVLAASGPSGGYRVCGAGGCEEPETAFSPGHPADPVGRLHGLAPAGGHLILTAAWEEGWAFLGPGEPAAENFVAVHGNLLAPSDAWVPLVVAGPGIEAGPEEGTGSLLDAARVVAELLGSQLHGAPALLTSSPDLPDDRPPVFLSPGLLWAVAGAPMRHPVVARDPEGARVSYRPVELPPGASLDGHRGELIWTPALEDLGTRELLVEAADPAGNLTEQRIRAEVVLGPVPDVRAEWTGAEVRLNWGEVDGAAAYRVQRVYREQHRAFQVTVTSPPWEDREPPRRTQVGYLVYAVDPAGRLGVQRSWVEISVPD